MIYRQRGGSPGKPEPDRPHSQACSLLCSVLHAINPHLSDVCIFRKGFPAGIHRRSLHRAEWNHDSQDRRFSPDRAVPDPVSPSVPMNYHRLRPIYCDQHHRLFFSIRHRTRDRAGAISFAWRSGGYKGDAESGELFFSALLSIRAYSSSCCVARLACKSGFSLFVGGLSGLLDRFILFSLSSFHTFFLAPSLTRRVPGAPVWLANRVSV